MLNLTRFKFCPRCGLEEIKQIEVKSIKCSSCGFVYYHNLAAAVGAVIGLDGKVLLCKRGREPEKGKLDFPGGFVEYNETLEIALKREVLEELGVEICNINYFMSGINTYRYQDVDYPTVDAYFKCSVVDIKKIIAGDDVDSFLWVSLDEIDFELLAFPSTRSVVDKLLGLE